jgi:hypothetical protein
MLASISDWCFFARVSPSLYNPSACEFLDDGGATGTTKQAIKDEIYEITHRPKYMDDTKNKLLFARVTKLYEQLVLS